MKLKKVKCYCVDLHYYDDVNGSRETIWKDVIIPCDLLDKVIEQEINTCDIIIKEKTFIYWPHEC